MFIIFLYMHNYKYKRSPARAKVFSFEKIFLWRSTRSRSARLEFAREENRNPRFVVDRHWNIRSFYITGVKKVPYNLSLNLRTWRWTVLFLSFSLSFFFLYMHKYHNRLRFHARLRMCHVYACIFLALHFIILLLLFLPFRRRRSTKRCVRFIRLASKVPL